MRVLVVVPCQVFMFTGGLRIQVERTVQELQKIDCIVDYWDGLTDIKAKKYDVIHIFSMNAPTYFQAIALKRYGVPIVFSSVMWRTGPRKVIKGITKLLEKAPFFLLSDTLACKKLAEMADLILPNTAQEMKWLTDVCDVHPEKCVVVPNGADDKFKSVDTSAVNLTMYPDSYILSISIISKRKNMLKLINAAKNINMPLIHIGGVLEESYYNEIMKMKYKKCHFLGHKDNSDPLMGALIRRARVFALVSEYETPGIAALEAGLQGANCVVTEVGGAAEYFAEHARYVNPSSGSDINRKIADAWNEPLGGKALVKHLNENFSWEVVAKKTMAAYKMVLK